MHISAHITVSLFSLIFFFKKQEKRRKPKERKSLSCFSKETEKRRRGKKFSFKKGFLRHGNAASAKSEINALMKLDSAGHTKCSNLTNLMILIILIKCYYFPFETLWVRDFNISTIKNYLSGCVKYLDKAYDKISNIITSEIESIDKNMKFTAWLV